MIRRFTTFSAIIFLAICFCHPTFAQDNIPVVNEIKGYVKYIDSVSELSHGRHPHLSSSIADGIIQNDDGKVVGGFGIYTLSNSKYDTAFRITYHSNLDVNTYKTYYYKYNKLIFARLELKDGETGRRTLYRKEEFYNNGHLVGTKIDSVKEGEQYLAWTTLSLFEDGSRYLADFVKDHKRPY